MRVAFTAVCSFAFGVLVMDTAHEWKAARCKADRENAEHYATLIAQLLTDGGRLTAPGAVASCRVKHTEEKT